MPPFLKLYTERLARSAASLCFVPFDLSVGNRIVKRKKTLACGRAQTQDSPPNNQPLTTNPTNQQPTTNQLTKLQDFSGLTGLAELNINLNQLIKKLYLKVLKPLELEKLNQLTFVAS